MTIIRADCRKAMKGLDEGSVDLIVTDPPYGLSFMGKDWDKAVPSKKIWRECLRVLKPGAFAFILCTPRQDCLSRMIVNLSDAGFDTGFTSIYWTYATGFPKAGNLAKLADKRAGVEPTVVGTETLRDFRNGRGRKHGEGLVAGMRENGPEYYDRPITKPTSPDAKALEGSYAGFQPKPAVEVVIVAMKPIEEKTFLDQALKNGHGLTWLDKGRIPANGETPTGSGGKALNGACKYGFGGNSGNATPERGRFAPNLLVCDARIARDKTVELKTGPGNGRADRDRLDSDRSKRDVSFSRYFDLDAWFDAKVASLPESARKSFPFLIAAKPSQSEKNAGLETRNMHPTVKPVKLMSYLIEIGSADDALILDPFVGSGTTIVAAELLSRRWIGIEMDDESASTAESRASWAMKEAARNKAAGIQVEMFGTMEG